jgi:hypothetical protein
MARYNSINTTSSVSGGSTISTPASGLLTTLTGSGTVAVPNPVFYTGATQTYYNSTVSAITLSTPSGVITGPGLGGGATSLSLPAGSLITLVSDGANYLTQDWLGGNISATTLSASAGVNLSPATGTITINPTTAGTIANMAISGSTGSFSTLTASAVTTITGGTAVTLGTAASGILQVSGGVGIGGGLSIGGTSYFASNVGIGTTSPGINLDVQGSGRFLNTGTATNASTGKGLEIQYATSGRNQGEGAYLIPYDRTGSAYKQFVIDASTTILSISGTTKVTVDTNGYLLVGYTSSQGTYNLQVNGNFYLSGLITEASSITIKENVTPIENALDLVLSLVGVTYDRRDGSRKNEPGLIAEEVYKRAPSLVSLDADGNPAGVLYTKLGPYLVEAIRILKDEIDLLKGKK